MTMAEVFHIRPWEHRRMTWAEADAFYDACERIEQARRDGAG